MIPTLHIHLLGDFLLLSGDTPITTVTIPRVQFLLAYLLLHRRIQQTGNKHKLGMYHLAFGISLCCSGHLDEAEEQLRNALHLGEQLDNPWMQTRSLTFLPGIFRWCGQIEQVRSLLAQAHFIGAAQNNRILIGHHAWLAWRENNLVEAESYGQASIEERQYQWMDNNPFQWTGLWPLIGVALAQEKIATAITYAACCSTRHSNLLLNTWPPC